MTQNPLQTPLRLGTRRSHLAMTQAGHVADLIRALGRDVELVEITSAGDLTQATNTPLTGGSSTGVFVSALRDALLAGEIDLAVHSLKDLPTYAAAGIVIAAIPPREDPRDVVVARDGLTLGELPAGAVVGTGSPRRAAQIKALGLGVELAGIRGNIDTRIQKMRDGAYDAVVLARAGLSRVGRLDEATELLDPLQVLPAPGQGALAVECRADDPATEQLLGALDDPFTRACVEAERAVLATLEGGCAAPIGTLAEVVEADDPDDAEGTGTTELWVRAVALSPDGTLSVRKSASGRVDDAVGVGTRLGEEMLADGADRLTDLHTTGGDPGNQPGNAAPDQNKVR